MTTENKSFLADLEYAAVTDIGMRRANNQDSHRVMVAEDESMWLERGHVFMVADGMGAHAAGELASKLAVDGVPSLYNRYRDKSPPEALEQAILDTNTEVNSRGQANPDFHQMGTTCSVMALLPQGVMIGHIGDSRVYRLRGEHYEQLTFDHSLVWELQAAGQIPEGAEVSGAIPKNVITRSLGPNANVQVDIEGPFSVEPGDTFLLCSDGLSGLLEDDEMGAMVASLSPQEAATAMVDLANLRGGHDNITVIVATAKGPALSTAVAGATPIKIGAKHEESTTNPAIWIAMGCCFLAALVMLITENFIPALIAGVGGLIALVLGLVKRSGKSSGGVALGDTRRLGKGPYTKTSAVPSAEFLGKLKNTLSELQQAAKDNEWVLDWDVFKSSISKAEAAIQNGKPLEAVREYGQTISFMMRALRNQKKKKPKNTSDSAIDL